MYQNFVILIWTMYFLYIKSFNALTSENESYFISSEKGQASKYGTVYIFILLKSKFIILR